MKSVTVIRSYGVTVWSCESSVSQGIDLGPSPGVPREQCQWVWSLQGWAGGAANQHTASDATQ